MFFIVFFLDVSYKEGGAHNTANIHKLKNIYIDILSRILDAFNAPKSVIRRNIWLCSLPGKHCISNIYFLKKILSLLKFLKNILYSDEIIT